MRRRGAQPTPQPSQPPPPARVPGGEPGLRHRVIELRGLGRTYPGPPPVPALRQADLMIDEGDYVAVTGPSGSGKSTLLHLLGLLDTPTSGTYLLDGLRLSRPEHDHTPSGGPQGG
jgi:putative ABC transport system ATP-binding protein